MVSQIAAVGIEEYGLLIVLWTGDALLCIDA